MSFYQKHLFLYREHCIIVKKDLQDEKKEK